MVFKGISLIQSRETKAKKGANMSCFTVIHNLGQSIFYWHMCGQNMMMSDLSMDTKLGLHGANGRSCLTSLEKQVEDIPGGNGERQCWVYRDYPMLSHRKSDAPCKSLSHLAPQLLI